MRHLHQLVLAAVLALCAGTASASAISPPDNHGATASAAPTTAPDNCGGCATAGEQHISALREEANCGGGGCVCELRQVAPAAIDYNGDGLACAILDEPGQRFVPSVHYASGFPPDLVPDRAIPAEVSAYSCNGFTGRSGCAPARRLRSASCTGCNAAEVAPHLLCHRAGRQLG
jgi:hypothetical protein